MECKNTPDLTAPTKSDGNYWAAGKEELSSYVRRHLPFRQTVNKR